MPFFRPFEPIRAREVPTGDAWIAQVKWDGVRAVAEVDGDGVHLWNRRGRPRTNRFPEIAQALRPFEGCAFDGEVIALSNGKPDFYQVLRRDQTTSAHDIARMMGDVPVWYAVFDVVKVGGRWIGDWPLRERLDWMVKHLAGVEHVLPSHAEVDTAALFEATEQLGLEGVVCKRADSAYLPGGQDGRWVKVKHHRDAIAAVGGVTYRDGAPNALMLGLFDERARLIHIGNAGSGRLNASEWADLVRHILSREIPVSPFARAAKTNRSCRFAQPTVAVKVRYTGWTDRRTLRHPVLLGRLELPATPEICGFRQADP
ncbi:DNA ligase [Alicyclobacillus fructus]|uniref:ATP-dependent DNA ligase n=1 Tax=Alicyclobacillus fructus TaxID=2816082 RepID=UPI001A8C7AEA|nr:DNA ligase [Alicyclobacillus fructus]